MRHQIILALILLPELCFGQSIKINELMYAPSNGEPEWVELYNDSSDSVNIKDWTICDKNGVKYCLRLSDRYILPDSYLVLTNTNDFANFHPEAIGSYIVVQWAQYFLVNSGDTVTLRDAYKRVVDSVFYAPAWGGSGGKSLERISSSDSSRLKKNWGTSIDPKGSTPGRRNSLTPLDYDLRITSFRANINVSESNASFNIKIKNSGRLPTSAFQISIFIDLDRDSVADSNELAATSTPPGLNPGDSTAISLSTSMKAAGASRALAKLNFSSDEDTTNNFFWTNLNLSYSPKSLVVNEIMYAPASPECEWVELENISPDSIDLRNFTLSDNSGTSSILTQTDFTLAPAEYVVVAHDTSFFTSHHGYPGKFLVSRIPSLNNSGDLVAIHDASGMLIDSVNYSPSWGGNTGGKSLERILPAGDSNDPQNFDTCVDSSKSTPGKINSITPRDYDLAIGNIIHIPSSVRAGDRTTFSMNLINRGLKTSGIATALLFNDKNQNSQCDPGEISDSISVPPVSPGDSITVSLLSAILQPGMCHFAIEVHYSDDQKLQNNFKTISIAVGISQGLIAINELMYAPKPPEQEWLEIYSNCDSAISLSDFRIVTHGGSEKIKPGVVISPHGYVVFCKDSSASLLHLHAPNLVVQSTPSLANAGDTVSIYDNAENLVDSMFYLPSFGGTSGKSLERIDFLAPNDPSNWAESVDSTGATPGAINSVAILPCDVAVSHLTISPEFPDPGEPSVVSFYIQNRGRNSQENIPVSVDVIRKVDSTSVLTYNESYGGTLSSGDSSEVSIPFTPDRAGFYKVNATVSAAGDTRKRNDTLSLVFSVKHHPQSIVVNEIMYSSGQLGEYFELFNTSNEPVDLTSWTFHTTSTQSKPIPISGGQKIVLPSRLFVVAGDSAILSTVSDTTAVQIATKLSLRDDGDCIVILDPAHTVVDSVYYSPSWHNADIVQTAHRSLEKINPTLPSNDRSSWSTCVSPLGGTPGTKNSLFVDAGTAAGGVKVAPNPFSPDGDGHDDFTFVSYSYPVSSVKIKMHIYDSMGRLIATPVDNAVLPSTGRVVWDGRDGTGKIVKFGLYILFLEMTGPDGKSLCTYKTPLVVAKKMR